MIRLRNVIVAVSLGLVGCSSQPSVYYTLTASANTHSETARNAGEPSSQELGLYTIASISVPAPVDDTLIIVRQSDDRLMKLAHDRWTAPLGKQLGNALAVALTAELGMPPLSSEQAATNQIVRSLVIDVQEFDLVPGRYSALSVLWQINDTSSKGKKTTLLCYTKVREAVTPGVAPLVIAQQKNIIKLASAIASVMRASAIPVGTQCQTQMESTAALRTGASVG